MDRDHRATLITGASGAIGRAIALKLAKPDAHLIIHYNRNISEAKRTAQLVEAQGAMSTLLAADLSDRREVESLVQEIRNLKISIDLLINNAGDVIRPASWNEQSDDDMVRTINLNLLAPMRLVRLIAPDMITRGSGQIINITTTYASSGAAPVLAYTVAKAGITTLTYAMARELGSYGIRVNAIAPGNFDTNMTSSAGPDTVKWIISTTPLGRLGRPEEVAHAIQYLLDATFVTGHVLTIDGGQILQI